MGGGLKKGKESGAGGTGSVSEVRSAISCVGD